MLFARKRERPGLGRICVDSCFGCHCCYRGPDDPRPDHRQHIQHHQRQPHLGLGSTTKNPKSGIRHWPGPALCFKYGIAIFPV